MFYFIGLLVGFEIRVRTVPLGPEICFFSSCNPVCVIHAKLRSVKSDRL